MKLIIGLGNPGNKYEKTRHNLGWRVIDQLHQNLEFDIWNLSKKFDSLISEGNFNNQKIILAKPQTFMNNSGLAVRHLADYYKIPSQKILIIHDEIDLWLGEIRLQKNRGSAGHQGIQSIIEKLETKDFIRMRIGIKSINSEQRTVNSEKFVLQKFTPQEEKIIQQTIKRAAQMIMTAL